jgi:hypothetical protein
MDRNEDLEATARSIIESNLYMVLGTADGSGQPWVSPVYYAAEGYTEFYWVSSPDATHSRNLAARPHIRIVGVRLSGAYRHGPGGIHGRHRRGAHGGRGGSRHRNLLPFVTRTWRKRMEARGRGGSLFLSPVSSNRDGALRPRSGRPSSPPDRGDVVASTTGIIQDSSYTKPSMENHGWDEVSGDIGSSAWTFPHVLTARA